MARNASPRIDWIDSLRGLAIIMVVLGHVLLGLRGAHVLDATGVSKSLLLFLYAVHMPILFYVSGFVSRDRLKPPRVFLSDLIQWIVVPYVVWSIVLVATQKLFPSATNAPVESSALLSILWAPISIYWFLYALFFIKLANVIANRLIPTPAPVALGLSILAAIYVEKQMLNGTASALSVNIACGFFFYALGRLISEKRSNLSAIARCLNNRTTLLISALLLSGIVFFYTRQPAEHLRALSEPQSLILATGTLGIILFGALSQKTRIPMLRLFGRYSMAIYVQHPFWGAATRFALLKAGMTEPLALTTLIVLSGLFLPIATQIAAERLHINAFFGLRTVALRREHNL